MFALIGVDKEAWLGRQQGQVGKLLAQFSALFIDFLEKIAVPLSLFPLPFSAKAARSKKKSSKKEETRRRRRRKRKKKKRKNES